MLHCRPEYPVGTNNQVGSKTRKTVAGAGTLCMKAKTAYAEKCMTN